MELFKYFIYSPQTESWQYNSLAVKFIVCLLQLLKMLNIILYSSCSCFGFLQVVAAQRHCKSWLDVCAHVHHGGNMSMKFLLIDIMVICWNVVPCTVGEDRR